MRRIALALVVLPLGFLLWHYGAEFLAVDACIDSGNVYDYQEAICRSDVVHLDYIPYTHRFGWLLALNSAIMFVGIIIWIRTRGRNMLA